MGLTVGSLFSGIGGLDLGLESAGFETKWFCEIEKFPQAVLRKHWPDTPIIEDVRDVTEKNVQRVDVIAGGFPCQDISWAGIGRGIDYDLSEQEGTRSGLWWEMWRVIRELRPRYVIAENVPALTHRGLDIVLGSLAQIGYDAEWQTISAASMGAPHIRERVFIVAYKQGARQLRKAQLQDDGAHLRQRWGSGVGDESSRESKAGYVAYGDNPRLEGRGQQRGKGGCIGSGCLKVAQPDWFAGDTGQPWPVSFKLGNAGITGLEGQERRGLQGAGRQTVGATDSNKRHKWVEAEYDFRGVAYGVSDRVGALKGYGNAVVPQVGYLVGRAVREHAQENGWWQ